MSDSTCLHAHTPLPPPPPASARRGEPDPGPLLYKLTGVIEHNGSTERGHYRAYVRERIPGGGEGAEAATDSSSAWFVHSSPQGVRNSPSGRVQVPHQRLAVRAHHPRQRVEMPSVHAFLPTRGACSPVRVREERGEGDGGDGGRGVCALVLRLEISCCPSRFGHGESCIHSPATTLVHATCSQIQLIRRRGRGEAR